MIVDNYWMYFIFYVLYEIDFEFEFGDLVIWSFMFGFIEKEKIWISLIVKK